MHFPMFAKTVCEKVCLNFPVLIKICKNSYLLYGYEYLFMLCS